MVIQNGNRPSQDSRQRTPVTPTSNIPLSTQIATNTSTQLALSKKSSSIEVRFKEENFSGAPTKALTYHFDNSTYVQKITPSPMMNVLSLWLTASNVELWNSILRSSTQKCLIKWLLKNCVQDAIHHIGSYSSIRSRFSELRWVHGLTPDTRWEWMSLSDGWISQQYHTIASGWFPYWIE